MIWDIAFMVFLCGIVGCIIGMLIGEVLSTK